MKVFIVCGSVIGFLTSLRFLMFQLSSTDSHFDPFSDNAYFASECGCLLLAIFYLIILRIVKRGILSVIVAGFYAYLCGFSYAKLTSRLRTVYIDDSGSQSVDSSEYLTSLLFHNDLDISIAGHALVLVGILLSTSATAESLFNSKYFVISFLTLSLAIPIFFHIQVYYSLTPLIASASFAFLQLIDSETNKSPYLKGILIFSFIFFIVSTLISQAITFLIRGKMVDYEWKPVQEEGKKVDKGDEGLRVIYWFDLSVVFMWGLNSFLFLLKESMDVLSPYRSFRSWWPGSSRFGSPNDLEEGANLLSGGTSAGIPPPLDTAR